MFALVQAVPARVVIRQTLLSRQQNGRLEWYPPGLVLAQLATLAALGIAAGFLLLLGQPGGLQGMLGEFLGAALAELGEAEIGGRGQPRARPLDVPVSRADGGVLAGHGGDQRRARPGAGRAPGLEPPAEPRA